MHNLHTFNGQYADKPGWNPTVIGDFRRYSDITITKIEYDFYSKYPIYVVKNAFDSSLCANLIKQFDMREQYAVGIDGYCNPDTDAGSYRTMAWGNEFSEMMTRKLNLIMDEKLLVFADNDFIYDNKLFAVPFNTSDMTKGLQLLGSTPWLRFMKYKSGGMHTPHHDAPFRDHTEQYITLFSWVLYLNDVAPGSGGNLQMVNDLKQKGKHPMHWDTSDWTNMATDITLAVKPEAGKLLIFPHWLCHQVEEYTGDDYRYIIRGDIAYYF